MTTTPFSKRLSEAKDELDLSTRQIVREAANYGFDISLTTVSHCLTGKHGQVTTNTVRALSKALRVPFVELAQLASLPSGRGHFRLEGRLAEYADSLTKQQADVVRDTMRLFAEGNAASGVDLGRSSLQEAEDEADQYDDRKGDEDHEDSDAPVGDELRERRERATDRDVQAALEDERTAALDQPPGEIPGEDR